MKSIVFTILSVLICSVGLKAGRTGKKKVEHLVFQVSGVCDLCEKRIEKAALIKGVRKANWESTSQQLEVWYVPKKTDVQAIHQAVADAGHDTEAVKAVDEVYEGLHACCKYRDGEKIH